MKCVVCGKTLQEGEINVCNECLDKYEKNNMKVNENVTNRVIQENTVQTQTSIEPSNIENEDGKAIYEVKNKFSIAYEIFKHFALIMLIIISIFGLFYFEKIAATVICLLLFFCYFMVVLINDNLAAGYNKISFYEDKLVYRYKNVIVTNEKTVKYEDVSLIKPVQTLFQRIFKRGDLCIYVKGKFGMESTINGVCFRNLDKISDVYEDICKLFESDRG